MNKHGEPTRLNWVRTGTSHTETVVLIHGVGHDLTYWDRQIEALESQFNVVAFDLPGHGRSEANDGKWSFSYAADVVTQLILEVSTAPVHLVGISFGGMIAQVTAFARPDLIRTLTLIGTASRFPDQVREGMRTRAELIRREGMVAVVQGSLERWFTEEFRENRPDIMDRTTKTLLGDDPATQAAIWDLIATLDTDKRLSELTCPTLILVGEHDPSTPPTVATHLAESIRDAHLVVLPGASHIATVETPNAVNQEFLRFLSEHSSLPS